MIATLNIKKGSGFEVTLLVGTYQEAYFAGRSAFKPEEWTEEHYKNFLRSQVKLLVKNNVAKLTAL